MFNLPFEDAKVDFASNIFKIISSPFSQRVIYLGENIISLVSTEKQKCPILSTYIRSDASVKEEGANAWCKWLNAETIVYGTYEGTVFISKISENNKIMEPKSKSFDFRISDAVIIYTYIGIFNQNSEIFILNESFETVKTINFERGLQQVSNLQFNGACLTGTLGGAPFIVYLQTSNILQNEPFMFYIESRKMVTISRYSKKNNIYAIATQNNSVFLMSSSSLTPELLTVCHPNEENDDVTQLFFINDETILLIFYASGKCVSYNLNNNEKITLNIKQLKGAIDIEIDVYEQQLFYTNFMFTKCIYLTKSTPVWFFTPTALYDPFHNQSIMNIGDDLPSEVYPIRIVAVQELNRVAVSNLNGFVIIKEDKICSFTKHKVNNMAIVDDYLFVFSHCDDGRYLTTIFNFDSKILKEFYIDIVPQKLSVSEKKISISSNLKFITLEIAEKNKSDVYKGKVGSAPKSQPVLSSEAELEFINGEVIKVKEYKPVIPIKDVCLLDNGSYVVLYNDETAYLYPKNVYMIGGVKSLSYFQEPSFVAMQLSEGSVLVYRDSQFEFRSKFSFFDDLHFAVILPEQEFGKIAVKEIRYSPHMISYFGAQKDIIEYFIDFYKGHDKIRGIFGDAIVFSTKLKTTDALLANYSTLDTSDFAASFGLAYNVMTNEMRARVNAVSSDHWARFFKGDLDPAFFASVILNIAPRSLTKILKNSKPLRNKKGVMNAMLKRAFFAAASIFSSINAIDMDLEEVRNIKEESIIEAMTNDKNNFPPELFAGAMKHFIFQCKKQKYWRIAAIAIFVLGGNDVETLLGNDKKLVEIYNTLSNEMLK